MAPRPITTAHRNRAVLARQSLLDRSRLPLPRVLERVAGIQSQYAPSIYVGLWSRMEGLTREAVTRALERRAAVQGTLMRATIHVVSRRDYPLLAAGVRTARRDWWLRTGRSRDLPEVSYADVEAILRAALADGPRRRDELIALLAAKGIPKPYWEGAGLWVDMVRVPPSGTWERRRADLYALADHWVGPPAVDEAVAIRHLVRRYLQGFGPAAVGDIGSWTGLPPATVRETLAGMRLRRFVDEEGTELVDLVGGPLPDPSTPAPVRFLPTWDASLLAHARRSGVLSEELRPHVFTSQNPQSVATFLVDGTVAGTWRFEEGRVVVQPYDGVPARRRDEVTEEAEGLARFHRGGEQA